MLIEWLYKNAETNPAGIAVADDQGQHTFQQIASLAAAVAANLSAHAGQAGTVAILLPPSALFVSAFYGTLLSSRTVVPLNYLLGLKELTHVISDAAPSVIITSASMLERLTQAMPALAGLADMARAANIQLLDITTLAPLPALPQPTPTPAPDDLAVVMYTSGTSALPKGAMLTYSNLQSDTNGAIQLAELKQSHVFLGVIPLFHSFGMTAMMLAPTQLGAKVVYLARFSPMGALQAIRDHKASLFFGVPSMFAAIGRLKNITPEDLRPLYALVSGAEPLPASVRELYATRFSINLLEGYGLTETSPIVTLNTPALNRPGSVGTAIPGCKIRIAPEEGGEAEQGEVQLSGPMVFKGYYNNPAATAAAFTPDGYFRTGDLGKLDEDGFLHITGRLKDLIIISGEKAHPREIEELISQHPAVAEAAVIGRKDENRGEVPVAFLTLREGKTTDANEIRTFCKDKGLPQWKVPRDVQILQDLPRSPTGKVLKRELAQLLP